MKRGILVAALAAAAVVTGVVVLVEAGETPPAFCPDSVDSDEPADEPSLGEPENDIALFDVAENGDMTDRSDQLDGAQHPGSSSCPPVTRASRVSPTT
ncbi:hypothetical protein [Amycolatopsis sp. 195334CR]|uniref:hypothetical protein n=1 Tax=Amycolatopsis sp. 195334CR TaxID=2814588 RepID=UPI001A8E437C|nr:hypothetical protein [Amycolatopsis sp. 195334CR]MBN6042314.1 hypothetical protein [Amycolatopsis sp. 195334CR]